MIAARNQKGFSLMELLIVIVIIGIIAGIASLGADYVRRERITSTMKELVADVQKIRMSALITGPSTSAPNLRGFGIRFDPPTTYYTFAFNDGDGNFAYTDASEEGNPKTTRNIGSSTNLQIAGNPAYNILIYDRFGTPTRYKSDSTTIATNPVMVILVSDASISSIKCVNITTSGIRGGVWDGTTCFER